MDRSNIHSVLAALVAEVDDGTVVPVPARWLRLLLDIEAESGDEALVDLTVPAVADMFGRHENTIRDWLQSGRLRGYKLHGKEWRVPRSAVREFQRRQREGIEPSTDEASASVDLGAWQRERARA